METSWLTPGTTSVSVSGCGPAADMTGLSRVCSDLLSRVDEFLRRVDVTKDSISHACECSQLIDKV